MRFFFFIITGLLFLDASSVASEPGLIGTSDLNALGIQYALRKKTDPIPNRIHVLRIDLSAKKVKPRVALGPDPDGDGPAEVSMTAPRKKAAGP